MLANVAEVAGLGGEEPGLGAGQDAVDMLVEFTIERIAGVVSRSLFDQKAYVEMGPTHRTGYNVCIILLGTVRHLERSLKIWTNVSEYMSVLFGLG